MNTQHCKATILHFLKKRNIKKKPLWDNMVYPTRMGKIKTVKSQCWQGCGAIRTFIYSCWECEMVQSLWKAIWLFLIKLNIHPPITSSITPRYLPKRTEIICPHKDLQMNVHSSFIHKYLSTGEERNCDILVQWNIIQQ